MWLATADPKNNSIGRYQTARDDIFNRAHENVEKEKFGLSINGGFFGLRKCVSWGPGEGFEAFGKTNAEFNAKPKDKCLKYVDTTPGQLVQDQLKNVWRKRFFPITGGRRDKRNYWRAGDHHGGLDVHRRKQQRRGAWL